MSLAPDIEHEANITQPDTFITISLEGDVYGLPLGIIRRVMAVTDITPVPHAPASIVGLTNLGGGAATVIDLRRLLGYESRIPPMPGLAVEHDSHPYILLVDEVGEVLSRFRRMLLPVPRSKEGRAGTLCTGVYAKGDTLIAMLDPGRLFDARLLNSFETTA